MKLLTPRSLLHSNIFSTNANDLCQKMIFDKKKVFSQIRQNQIRQLKIIFRVARRLQRSSA